MLITPFERDSDPPVRGFLHQPATPSGDALVLTHGAGSNCRAPLLVTLADAFAQVGFTVLRCDLPFRQKRPHGPPFRSDAAEDREGLRNAVRAPEAGQASPLGRIFLGGHSYGGRQATILVAAGPLDDAARPNGLRLPPSAARPNDTKNVAIETQTLVDGLLLLSYPLHPPRKPGELRTAHFPALRIPALFVHGSRDPFGSLEEMRAALALIPAPTLLLPVEGVGHDLGFSRKSGARMSDLPNALVSAFRALVR